VTDVSDASEACGSGESFVMLVAGDITERRRAEEALQTARHELARVSRVSTLGELAASIAHEVNQPLAAIVTNGAACQRWLAAQPPDPGEASAAAERIVRDANRAGEVITRIRAFLRHGELRREAVDLAGLVGEVLSLVRGQAAEARVALHFDPAAAAGLPGVPVDRVQIQQVLLNLLMNALEAMQPHGAGARRIDISLARCAATALAGEDGLAVWVRDSGVGIPAGQAGAIFEAFHTSKPGGMGMGLAISRSIVEAHGGRLELLPLPGPGATFRFCLPLAA
jgi:C4-dicarboxylate-specific signal transduction histidine kinase